MLLKYWHSCLLSSTSDVKRKARRLGLTYLFSFCRSAHTLKSRLAFFTETTGLCRELPNGVIVLAYKSCSRAFGRHLLLFGLDAYRLSCRSSFFNNFQSPGCTFAVDNFVPFFSQRLLYFSSNCFICSPCCLLRCRPMFKLSNSKSNS